VELDCNGAQSIQAAATRLFIPAPLILTAEPKRMPLRPVNLICLCQRCEHPLPMNLAIAALTQSTLGV